MTQDTIARVSSFLRKGCRVRRSRRTTPKLGPPVKLYWWPRGGEPMASKRKIHGGAFKAQVALAAHKGDRTVNELAGHYGVHPTLIHAWKKQLITGAVGIFESPAKAASADAEARQAELFEQIGRLKMELEWLKKKGDSALISTR